MKLTHGLLVVALSAACTLAQAATLRAAASGDVTSMDPHALNETLQLSFMGNVYEPLVGRDKNMGVVPLLATTWRRQTPTLWRFSLRKGVQFHDGAPFTADDVVFTFKRAQGEGSDMKSDIGAIKEIRKVDDFTVEVETAAPLPILPQVLSNLYIMSRSWCVDNKAENAVDRRKGVENAASFKANGTGPFRVKERQPGTRTVLVRHGGYWDKSIESNLDEVVFTPITNDATRVAALLSGEIDLIDPVPLQDVPRVRAAGFTVQQGPELRTIFLGMDLKRDQLLYSSVKGKNPFKDKRVRQAIYQAIDVEGIKTHVMRGASLPTAQMVGPGVQGFQPDMNKRLPHDPEAAKKLMAEAGYAGGFDLTMNCSNDRYVNDEQICLAIAANLAKIGIRVNLAAESKTTYFPRLGRRETSFYIHGWTPGTIDAHDTMFAVMSSQGPGGQGQFNVGGYSNPAFDELTRQVQSEVDLAKRNQLVREAFKIHQDDMGQIPLHQQALAWGFPKSVQLVQLPSNRIFFKWATVKGK